MWVAKRTASFEYNECLANTNLLQLASHHGTDSVKDLGLLFRNKMLRPVDIMVVSDTRSVFLMSCQSFQSFLDQFGLLVPHQPVTISSRTNTGPRPSVYDSELQHGLLCARIRSRVYWTFSTESCLVKRVSSTSNFTPQVKQARNLFAISL